MKRFHINLPQLIFLAASFFGGLFYSVAHVGKPISQYGGMAWVALSLVLLFLSRFGTRRERAVVTVPILLLQFIILYYWTRFPSLPMSFFWLSQPVTISNRVAIPLHVIFLVLGVLYLIAELNGPWTEEKPA